MTSPAPSNPPAPAPASLLPPTRTLLLRRAIALGTSLAVGAALAAAALPPVELPEGEEEEGGGWAAARAAAAVAAAAAASASGGPPPPPLPLPTRVAAALDGAADRVGRAARAGGTLWRAASADGWEVGRLVGRMRRRTGEEGEPSGGLGAVADWATRGPDTRRALADVGGARLGRWLLAAAAEAEARSPDREAAEAALAALLADPRTAACVLRPPGARADLLRLAAGSARPDRLSEALVGAVASAAAAAASPAARAAADAARLRPRPSPGPRLADVRVAVGLLSGGDGDGGEADDIPPVVRDAALALLAAWAEAGPLEAGKVAAMGGGAALASAAARLVSDASASASSSSSSADARKARAALVRAMHALADALPAPEPTSTAAPDQPRRRGLRSPLAPAGWVDPLAYFLADALAEGDEPGAAAAADALAAALAAGAGLGAGADATAGTLGPLLVRAASALGTAPEVRASACRALAAAARSPAARPALGEALLDEVAELLIGRLVAGSPGQVAKAAADAAKAAAEAKAAAAAAAAAATIPLPAPAGGGWKRPTLPTLPKKKPPPPPPPPPGPGEAAAAVAALAALCGEPRSGGAATASPPADGDAAASARGRERAAAWLGDLLVAASMDATPMGVAAAAAAKAKSGGGGAGNGNGNGMGPPGEATAAAADAAPAAGWAGWVPGWVRGVWSTPTPPQPGPTPLADLAGDDAGTDAPDPRAAAAAEVALGGDGRAGRGVAAAAAAVASSSTSTLTPSPHYATAVAVGPAWARGVAADLRDRFGRAAASFAEPPGDGLDALLGPAASAAYPAAAAAVDVALADAALADALAALAELAGPEPSKVRWLASAGVVPLLSRLVVDRDSPPPPTARAPGDDDDGADKDEDKQQPVAPSTSPLPGPPKERPALPARRAAARLLAMVALTPGGAAALGADPAALAWLAAAAGEADCTLASHAARAGLALEAHAAAGEVKRLAAAALRGGGGKKGTTGGAPPVPPLLRGPVADLMDGVHLFQPGAGHHLALARGVVEGGSGDIGEAPSTDPPPPQPPSPYLPPPDTPVAPPLIDVVFVHGLRGGPFATWRVGEEVAGNGQGADHDAPAGAAPPSKPVHHARPPPPHPPIRDGAGPPRRRRGPPTPPTQAQGAGLPPAAVWPAVWLAADAGPRARLLSVDYSAPASGWEGESLPLAGTVSRLADRLVAAGVGDRPVVFVCHSLGGIVVKEMLAAALAADPASPHARLGTSTAGAVFYACPHRGSWLAGVGWNLRFVGAAPAASVVHLKPGPHLEDADAVLQRAHAAGSLRVLSFGETARMAVAPLLPRVLVVPPDSAAPGYGAFWLLAGRDHIAVCKPGSRADPAYGETAALVAAVLADAERRERGGG